MACNCSSSTCGCGTLTIPRGPRGFDGEIGPAPELVFPTPTTLPPGSDVTINVVETLGTYTISLGLPAGATGTGTAGTNGRNAFTTTTAPFSQPANTGAVYLNGLPIQVVDNSWAQPGQWIYIPGGGDYFIRSKSGLTTINIANPGFPYYSTGIVSNAPVGTVIGTGAGVTPGGRPGTDGATGGTGIPGTDGNPGVDAELLVVSTVPVAAPAPGRATVIVTDSPTTPTFTRLYSWNSGTTSWNAVGNIQGAAGTQIVTTPGDPNVTLPVGAIGTVAIRTDVVSIYTKTGTSTWTLSASVTPTFQQVATTSSGDFGTTPVSTQRVMGFVPLNDTHAAPGVYTLDLQYQGIEVNADKDIELDFDDTSFGEQAEWVFAVTNTDGSPINVTYTAGKWAKATGLTEPATIAAGVTQFFHCNRFGTRVIINNTYVAVNI